ncbi:MAG: hypothetical protein ABSH06_25110 [Thermodesulfobacteriota bacterium]|jgi:hypothetical protein
MATEVLLETIYLKKPLERRGVNPLGKKRVPYETTAIFQVLEKARKDYDALHIFLKEGSQNGEYKIMGIPKVGFDIKEIFKRAKEIRLKQFKNFFN